MPLSRSLAPWHWLACVFLLFAQSAVAQTTPPLDQLSLAELMDIKIAVASATGVSQREAPGIVTLVTHDELQRYGIRDLTEVLRLIPGFEFGSDLAQINSAVVRGNWAMEGKILLLIDGLETQDIGYSNTLMGNRFGVDQIERIEIIRGPGSAIYGGNAELAVINVITREFKEMQGVNASATYGRMASTTSRAGINLSAAKAVNGLALVGHVYASQGHFTNKTQPLFFDHTDSLFVRDTVSFAGKASQFTTINVNTSATYKGLKVRVLYDYLRTPISSYAGLAYNQPRDYAYHLFMGDIRYDWKAIKNLVITPRLTYKFNQPYQNTDTELEGESAVLKGNYFFNEVGTRMTGSLRANWTPTKTVSLLAGSDYFWERVTSRDGIRTFWNGSNQLTYSNIALYAQLLANFNIANLAAGIRYENHSAVEPVVVPRISLTRTFGKFHVKALYSQAFRAPAAYNINGSAAASGGNPFIKPETMQAIEIEAGYLLTKDISLVINTFDLRINNPIVYISTQTTFGYANVGQTGTQGIEAEVRVRKPWGNIVANYSYNAVPSGRNNNEAFAVMQDSTLFLGAAHHKAVVRGDYSLTKNTSVALSGIWLSPRYAQMGYLADTTLVESEQPAVLLLNLYVNSRNCFGIKGLSIGAGANNLLNANYTLVQPYNGYESPLPYADRDVFVRVGYGF